MNKPILILLCALCTLLLTACPHRQVGEAPASEASTAAPVPAENADTSGTAADTESPGVEHGRFFPESGPPKQVILFYTGGTLSNAQPKRSAQTTEGGLCALAHTISDYQGQILDFNRQRVESEGGDPASIRANLAEGLLGEHPYLLLDYGGWERPNDYAGCEYVALYFRFFTDYHYNAVAGKQYLTLDDQRWTEYRDLDYAPTLLVTGVPPKDGTLSTQPLATRELHGQLWGIVAPPLPGACEDEVVALEPSLSVAQTALSEAGCEMSIMLLADAPTRFYRSQAEESPFTVIIGADPRTGVKTGYGEMPEHGALLLPTVLPSGRQVAVCHLYFEPGGDRPVMYYLTILECTEDEPQPWPYRRLVREAAERHQQRVDEHEAAEKQGK